MTFRPVLLNVDTDQSAHCTLHTAHCTPSTCALEKDMLLPLDVNRGSGSHHKNAAPEKSESLVEVEGKSGSLKPSAVKATKKKWKKPKDKPKRPLSAYNIFFRHEHENLLYGTATVGEIKPVRIGFSELAKNIAAKWKRLDPADSRRIYEIQADFEQHRYDKAEVEEWRRIQDGGSPAVSVSPRQDADWTATQLGMANLPAANVSKPSPKEMLDHCIKISGKCACNMHWLVE